MSTNSVQFHRVLTAPPERVYKAFVDADVYARWLPPDGFVARVHHMEPSVGKTYRMSFTNFTTGNGHAFGGTYLELVPGERIRYTSRFDDPNLAGEMETIITLRPVSCGTEMTVVQTGIPTLIPVESCYVGWQQSLQHLARLVEPEILE